MQKPHSQLSVSVVVLTFNEEQNIEKCLKSIKQWGAEIFVVDSFSTDRTLEIVKNYTSNIVQHKYEGHAQQWQFALDCLDVKTEWVFAMDADFVLTPELCDAVHQITCAETDCDGFYVRHRQVFRGKFIRFGTIYPRYWLRLFRKGKVSVDANDLVDLHFYVDGKIGKIEFDVIEDNKKESDIAFWVEKQCKFAKRQAHEEFRRRTEKLQFPVEPSLLGTPDQRTLFLKKYWYKMPLFVRPFVYFFYRYILRLGFLDGKQGFIYHFTQAFLYRLMVDIELDDLYRSGSVNGQ